MTASTPGPRLKSKQYEKELRKLQAQLCQLQEGVTHKGLRVVILFEGRDAAGKGGTIKAITEPVELWWAHHPDKGDLECRWAMALASLPGVCCPAPRCGANDCKKCPAHLFHTNDRPDCERFLLEARRDGVPSGRVLRSRLD